MKKPEKVNRPWMQKKTNNLPPELQAFYNSTQWRKLSKLYRKAHPICEHCNTSASKHTDHIKPISTNEGWELRLDWDNFQALCIPCHSIKTIKDRIL